MHEGGGNLLVSVCLCATHIRFSLCVHTHMYLTSGCHNFGWWMDWLDAHSVSTHCASTSADGFHGPHVTLGRRKLLLHSVCKEECVWGRLACEPIQAVPMPTRASLSVESIRFSCAVAWIRCVACYSRSRTGVKLPIVLT